MLDRAARRLADPALNRMGAVLAGAGVSADSVTVVGFVLGLGAAAVIAVQLYWVGLILVVASRLCDGLDGPVARHSVVTDRGGFLDIVLDFAFYGAVPLGFVFAAPDANAVAGAVLIFSFYANGASFLAFAVMAERRKLTSAARGPKSLYFTAGLAEGTETILVFCLFCIFPGAFVPIAYMFAALTLVTTVSRIALATRSFG